jgi:restriction system protein
MSVPTYDRFIEPLLRYLAARPDGADIDDVYEGVANATRLPPEDRLTLLPSGRQPVYKNRIGWAHDRLKRAGLSTSAKRGFWKLTANGAAPATRPTTLAPSDIEHIAMVGRARTDPSGGESTLTSPSSPAGSGVNGPASPDERIERALAELHDSVAHDLLDRIGQASPAFFEVLVLELLHAMGYGASVHDLQRVGGSGDGGIDGIISLDRLGLEKVYVQAKRWQGTIGSPQVQTFMGALQLQGANKGVFLTTSTFTKDARDAATKARGTIVLVDGTRLTHLMIEHGIAVTHKPLKVPKVDGDYFDDG